MAASSDILGRTEKLHQQPSALSNELDWSSPVPAEDSSTRLIPLTRGMFAVVDAADYASLSVFKWQARKSPTGGMWYAGRGKKVAGKSLTILMHRQILGITDSSILIDHQDRNGLHNWRGNLRICTRAQNQSNRTKPSSGKTSAFKGVHWMKGERKFCAKIKVNRRVIVLGKFADEILAAQAYDRAAIEHHGEFACLNFPGGAQ